MVHRRGYGHAEPLPGLGTGPDGELVRAVEGGPGSTVMACTLPVVISTTKVCVPMSKRYEQVKYLPCAWISGS